MAVDVQTFKGEAPRVAPRLLPNDMAVEASNPRLISGNLEAWYGYNAGNTQPIVPNPATIYFLDDQLWLAWNAAGVISTTPTVTQETLPASTIWSSIATDGHQFVALARNNSIAATSPDGVTWTQQNLPSVSGWIAVAWSGSIFCAVTEANGLSTTSPDGVTWTQYSALPVANYTDIAWNGATFCAVAFGESSVSVNGQTWTNGVLPSFTPGGIATDGSKFVVVLQGSGNAAHSTDGINWTLSAMPAAVNWSDIAWNGSVFCAISGSGSNVAATSPDGITWTAQTLPGTEFWQSICSNGSAFVAVAESSTTAAVSLDGATWTTFSLSASSAWVDAVALGLKFFVVSANSISFGDLVEFTYAQSPIIAPAIEVDVAKAAIAGDTSVRTFFCGLDCPRFTDLGLASGLVDGSGHPTTGADSLGPSGGPYPVYTRKLGVPNPTLAISNPTLVPAAPGASAVVITETFDGATDWNLNSVPGIALADIVVSGGHPGACLTTRAINNAEAFGWKTEPILNVDPVQMDVDFAYQRLANDYLLDSSVDFFFNLDSGASGAYARITTTAIGIDVYLGAVNNGVIGAASDHIAIAAGAIPTWHTDADPNWTGPFVGGHWYHATFAITPGANPAGALVTFKVTDGATTVFNWTTAAAGIPNAGPGYGMGCSQIGGMSFPDFAEVWFDNLVLAGTGPAPTTAALEATTYVYTVVNDLGEESGPCPAMTTVDGSGTITRPIGQGVSVNLPGTLALSGVDTTYFEGGTSFIPTTQIPPNQSITSPSMNLYRAVTGSNGTELLLVAANIPFSGGSVTTYVDSVPDAALSEVIQSTLWYPPPTSMLGILALPNEIYVGFTGNQLCLSAQGVPHAWPIAYRLTFDFDIVGIGNIDNTVVVCTKNYPWLCSGNTPDAYSQTKGNYPFACASKRSIRYLKGRGVVYATFEGLVAIAGPGREELITEALFSKREWGNLNPGLMTAEINDGRYFCWTEPGGFIIDLMQNGVGKVTLSDHAIARYNDPLSDELYMVLDSIVPNDPSKLGNILAWDSDFGSQLEYDFVSKQFYVQYPTTMRMARVTADSYLNTTLNLYADGVQYASIPVASQKEFTLPAQQCLKYFQFEIVGTDPVTRVQIVEDSEEFT